MLFDTGLLWGGVEGLGQIRAGSDWCRNVGVNTNESRECVKLVWDSQLGITILPAIIVTLLYFTTGNKSNTNFHTSNSKPAPYT